MNNTVALIVQPNFYDKGVNTIMFNIDSFLNFNNGSLKIELGEYTDYLSLHFVINKNSIGHYNIKYEHLYRNFFYHRQYQH